MIPTLIDFVKTENPLLNFVFLTCGYVLYRKYGKNNISEDSVKVEVIIDASFDLLYHILYDDISKIIINNHVKDKEIIIRQNVATIVIARYYEVYHKLLPFKVDALNKNWLKEIEQLLVDVIFSDDDIDTKLYYLKRNLSIKIDSCKVYLKNKNSHFEKT